MAVFGLGDNSNPGAAAVCMQRMIDSADSILSELSQSAGGELRLGVGCTTGEIVQGIADAILVRGLEDFRVVDLPDSLRVRDFHELIQIGVVAC